MLSARSPSEDESLRKLIKRLSTATCHATSETIRIEAKRFIPARRGAISRIHLIENETKRKVSSTMRELVKQIIKGTPLYHSVRSWRSKMTASRRRANWEKAGMPAPPPDVVKQDTIKDFSRRYGLKTLVETGTYMGDMVQAIKGDFERVYSIELGQDLAIQAQQRFARDKNVTIIEGDSGLVLKELLPEFSEPVLFWLDAHYSEGTTAQADIDTPILQELQHILKPDNPRHVVLIDDARYFGVDDDYPTIEELKGSVAELAPDYVVSILHDSIRIVPIGRSRYDDEQVS